MIFKIVPKTNVFGWIDADDADAAMDGFVWGMQDDMNHYFEAVPVSIDQVDNLDDQKVVFEKVLVFGRNAEWKICGIARRTE